MRIAPRTKQEASGPDAVRGPPIEDRWSKNIGFVSHTLLLESKNPKANKQARKGRQRKIQKEKENMEIQNWGQIPGATENNEGTQRTQRTREQAQKHRRCSRHEMKTDKLTSSDGQTQAWTHRNDQQIKQADIEKGQEKKTKTKTGCGKSQQDTKIKPQKNETGYN